MKPVLLNPQTTWAAEAELPKRCTGPLEHAFQEMLERALPRSAIRPTSDVKAIKLSLGAGDWKQDTIDLMRRVIVRHLDNFGFIPKFWLLVNLQGEVDVTQAVPQFIFNLDTGKPLNTPSTEYIYPSI